MSKILQSNVETMSKYMEQCGNLIESVRTTENYVLELCVMLDSHKNALPAPEEISSYTYAEDSVIGCMERAIRISSRTNAQALDLVAKIHEYLGRNISIIG